MNLLADIVFYTHTSLTLILLVGFLIPKKWGMVWVAHRIQVVATLFSQLIFLPACPLTLLEYWLRGAPAPPSNVEISLHLLGVQNVKVVAAVILLGGMMIFTRDLRDHALGRLARSSENS